MEEQKQEGDINAFAGETVGIAATLACEQTVALEFAEVVAELVESVLFRGDLERRDNRLVNLFGRPATDGAAVVQENFQQPNDSHILDFDAGVTNRTDGDGQGDALQEGKVHMDVEGLRLEGGEAVRDGLEPLTDGFQVVESFFQAEVAQVVGTEFIAC